MIVVNNYRLLRPQVLDTYHGPMDGHFPPPASIVSKLTKPKEVSTSLHSRKEPEWLSSQSSQRFGFLMLEEGKC